jgi:hypothetical protein
MTCAAAHARWQADPQVRCRTAAWLGCPQSKNGSLGGLLVWTGDPAQASSDRNCNNRKNFLGHMTHSQPAHPICGTQPPVTSA